MIAPNAGMQLQTLGAAPAQVMPVSAQAMPQPMPQQVPQTGLIGSEQALGQGYQQANQALTQGTNAALGAYSQLGASYAQPLEPIKAQTFDVNTTAGAGAINQGVEAMNPYAQAGGAGAAKLQADLSGANGVQAQQAARAAFSDSPGQQYLIDQSERAIQRSAAAKGGLLGGNVLRELQQNAVGLAAQDYQNQFANLGSVAQTGLSAASNQAQLRSQQAQSEASLTGQQLGANAAMAGQTLAANTALQQQRESLKADLAGRISDLNQNLGLNKAQLATGYSQQLSSGRMQTGQGIAQNAAAAGTQLADLLNKQGVQVSGQMQNDISNMSNLIYNSGMQDQVDMNNLAAVLANISGAQSSQNAAGYQNLGAANSAGTLGMANALNTGVQNYMIGTASGAIK